MDESLGYIRIRQLPESTQLQSSDYLVIENDLDTWRVRVQVFNDYIDQYIESFKCDIDNIINNKFNEIQLLINNIDEIIVNMNNQMTDYTEAENERQKNEEERKEKDEIRDKIFQDMSGNFDNWSQDNTDWLLAEEQRKRNEQQRITNEQQRQQNESDRQTAEQNRGTAEGNRQTAEAERTKNEEARKKNEADRVSSFNSMTLYFNALEESVEKYGKAGISKATTSSTLVVPILEVSIPSSNTNDYEALLYIREGETDKEAFFGFVAKFARSGSSITSGTAYLNIPDRFKTNINKDMFVAKYTIDGDRVIITLEYKASAANRKVKTEIIWDNISMFRSDVKPMYSLALRDQTPKASFDTVNLMTISLNNTYGSPQGFITILNKIKEETDSLIDAIKPYKMFPVGSIYQTTSTQNPSVLLGGGVWRQLYGGGWSEGMTINNQEQYSPVIYYWERTQ